MYYYGVDAFSWNSVYAVMVLYNLIITCYPPCFGWATRSGQSADKEVARLPFSVFNPLFTLIIRKLAAHLGSWFAGTC